MNVMSREEHLSWCKRRALEYWREGDLVSAVSSMLSDMGKRPDTEVNSYLAQLAILHIQNGDAGGVYYWIEGFR